MMVKGTFCIVCCSNKENLSNNGSSKSLFRFPISHERRAKWISNLRLSESMIRSGSRVCEYHFRKDQFVRTRLKHDAVPSLALYVSCTNRKDVDVSILLPPVQPCPFVQNNIQAVLCSVSSFPPLTSACLPVTEPSKTKADGRFLIPSHRSSQNDLKQLRLQRKTDRQKIKRLQRKVVTLEKKLEERVDIKEVFSKNLTFRRLIESQIDRYKSKKSIYTDFEKTVALSIYYSCGFNGYRTLQKMGFCLPARSTLYQWTSTFKLFTGVNPCLFSCIKEAISDLSVKEKDCLITWDEMSIKEFIEYNKHYDMFEGLVDFGVHGRTLEAANEVLVFMIRSLNSNWKFPISYYFSNHATVSAMLDVTVKENIQAVQHIGLKIRLAICDMSFTNQGLYRAWGIDQGNPSKLFNGDWIYFIHDTPHLLKLVRNNLMKHNFVINNSSGKEKIKWSHITGFFLKDKRLSSRMAPRLTNSHIYLKDYSKMKVKLATQVFSHSVYAGIMTMCQCKILKKEFKNTAHFIKKIDEIFDFLNMSAYKNDKFGRCAAYFYQNIYKLDEYVNFFESIEIPTLCKDPEFLKGFKLTVTGIKNLAIDLLNEGYSHLFTRHLQQDCLENYFSLVRGKGGHCRNPTARGFRTNFRFLFFANLIYAPLTGNTESRSNGFATYIENMQHFMVSKQNVEKHGPNPNETENLDSMIISSQQAALFYSVKLSRLKFASEQEAEVAVYVGAACIRAGLKLTNCTRCKEMLITKSESRKVCASYYLIDFKQFSDFNCLAYLKRTCDIFKYITSMFVKVACEALNVTGVQIAAGIMKLYLENDYLNQWLNEACYEHRLSILKYFIRVKIFRLVKDKNADLRQATTWSQTRRDLRNQ